MYSISLEYMNGETRSKYPGIGYFDKAVFFGRANLTPFKCFSRAKKKEEEKIDSFIPRYYQP